MTTDAFSAFLEASVRTATPLAYAALGEVVVERAGVINIGLEGVIIAGAFGALVASASGGVGAGFAGAILAGVILAASFSLFVVVMRVDQIITGTAVSMLGLGLTGTLYRLVYSSSGAALHTPTAGPLIVPVLSQTPVVGKALFAQPASTYALYVIVPALAWWMFRTTAGLALRAVGESPSAAAAAGISPARVRTWAILFGGAMGGASGGTLVLSQVGTFAEGMSAGRGFIAIAIVVLGRWTPLGVAGSALLFGAASALQYLSQAMGWDVPYQASLVLPYLLTLVALAGAGARSAAPAALGET
jgi:simple sugar transport system permease protein